MEQFAALTRGYVQAVLQPGQVISPCASPMRAKSHSSSGSSVMPMRGGALVDVPTVLVRGDALHDAL